MRLIDADGLKEAFANSEHIKETVCGLDVMEMLAIIEIIDNAPTVLHDNYSMGYQDGVKKVLSERPQGEWSLVERKKNIDLVCPYCGYHRCNLAYGFSIEEVREQIKEDTDNDFLIPDFCERCGTKLELGMEGGRQ